MPQLIAVALIGAVGWYAYSVLIKKLAELAEQDRKDAVKRPGATKGKVIDELERDPETGVYRPKKMD